MSTSTTHPLALDFLPHFKAETQYDGIRSFYKMKPKGETHFVPDFP